MKICDRCESRTFIVETTIKVTQSEGTVIIGCVVELCGDCRCLLGETIRSTLEPLPKKEPSR